MHVPLTIVMYHFVRPIRRSRYPAIKGLELDSFRSQIDHLRRNYNIVRMEDVIDAAVHHEALPPNAALLTFDDGYADHYQYVMPLLDDLGLQGSFFPPGKVVAEARVLDVNKIHFVLASVRDPAELVQHVFEALDRHRAEWGLEPNHSYYDRLSTDGRFDSPDVLFVKRMLQRELPPELRSRLIDQLFSRYVTADEAAFAGELYVSREQLRHMIRTGMHVGSHGYDHLWMNTLSRDQQEREIDLSLQFLADLGVDLSRWVMCYPYGGCNGELLQVVRSRGCAIGLGTRVGVADLKADDPLELPRLDTNDLPVAQQRA